jgi:hypothetical protein
MKQKRQHRDRRGSGQPRQRRRIEQKVERIGRKSAEDGGAESDAEEDLDDDERHDACQSQHARDGKWDR